MNPILRYLRLHPRQRRTLTGLLAGIKGMPAGDLEAPPAVKLWQCRIARDSYLIHRRASA